METLGMGQVFRDISMLPRGLVLVTGPTGSGKSTTLAAMIDFVNDNRYDHILTIEDPIEFVHESKRCLVNQRSCIATLWAFQRPCVRRCVRTLTSFWLERCAISRRSAWL